MKGWKSRLVEEFGNSFERRFISSSFSRIRNVFKGAEGGFFGVYLSIALQASVLIVLDEVSWVRATKILIFREA